MRIITRPPPQCARPLPSGSGCRHPRPRPRCRPRCPSCPQPSPARPFTRTRKRTYPRRSHGPESRPFRPRRTRSRISPWLLPSTPSSRCIHYPPTVYALNSKRQPGWDPYENAAVVLAGECGRRSESCCVTPFFLNPITWSTNLKPFVRLPKEKPTRGRAGFCIRQVRRQARSRRRGRRYASYSHCLGATDYRRCR